jgi:hypothetical protein
MNRTEPQEIFLSGTHGVGRQDKNAPERVQSASDQPVPPHTPARPDHSPAADKHHGSRTRQTEQIAGWVKPHIKAEVKRIEKLKGWSQSKTVGMLVEQALAKNLGEQFAVMIRQTIQEAVRAELRKDRAWQRKITLSNYLASEQTRLHVIGLQRSLLPPGEDINRTVKDNRSQSYKNLPFYFRSIDVQDEQQSWPSST